MILARGLSRSDSRDDVCVSLIRSLSALPTGAPRPPEPRLANSRGMSTRVNTRLRWSANNANWCVASTAVWTLSHTVVPPPLPPVIERLSGVVNESSSWPLRSTAACRSSSRLRHPGSASISSGDRLRVPRPACLPRLDRPRPPALGDSPTRAHRSGRSLSRLLRWERYASWR
jgi:hypothetical protein